MTTAKETAKNLWAIGSNGEVRACDEAALAREVKRALDGKDLSRNFMTACADLFFQVLDGEYGFVPEGELARTCPRAPLARGREHTTLALSRERLVRVTVSPAGCALRARRGAFCVRVVALGYFVGGKVVCLCGWYPGLVER